MRFHALVGSVGAVAGRSTAQACLSRRAVTPGYGDAALGTEGRAGLLWDFFFFFVLQKSLFETKRQKPEIWERARVPAMMTKLVWKGKSQPKSGQRKEQMGATGGL